MTPRHLQKVLKMNRLDILKEKFPEYYEEAISVEDPSGKQKYLLWIAKQLSGGHNATDISQTLKFFHDNPEKFKIKDIHKYKDLKDLEDIVKEFGISNRQSKAQDKECSEKIFEDDNLMVVRVDDKPAMILYGANTRWCTTMKDQTYYEDYVCQGNDFYIVIRKNPKALASTKYAIVRKGLLEFGLYDAQDHYARSFSEKEEETLRDPIKAIISDKPPKNYLRMVCNGNITGQEAGDWLKAKSKTTREYVENKRPDLRFIYSTTEELIEIFTSQWNLQHLKTIDHKKIIEIADCIKESKDDDKVKIKLEVLKHLKDEERLVLSKDRDIRVRAAVVQRLDSDKAKDFLSDASLIVFKVAASKVEAKILLDFISKSKSSRKKKAANEVIVDRISQEKVREFVLNQPTEVLIDLMT